MTPIRTTTTLALICGLTACASTPREFTPTVERAGAPALAEAAEPPGEPAAEPHTLLAECRQLVAAGHTSGFVGNRGASTGVGVAAGAATGVATLPVAGLAAVYGAGGAMTAALAAVPVVGIAAAFGASRVVRAHREKKVKTAMETCLAEHGYRVSGWERAQP